MTSTIAWRSSSLRDTPDVAAVSNRPALFLVPFSLIPSASGRDLRSATKLALTGAVLAGLFGVLHDQITYTISAEYFTRMKFDQFRAADFGFPPRGRVALIGFLGTWWVGLIGAWFLARLAVRKWQRPEKPVMKALLAIIGIAVAFGIAGYFAGPALLSNRAGWSDALAGMGVTDAQAFHRVAAIHLGSYAGAFLGWLAMLIMFLRRPS